MKVSIIIPVYNEFRTFSQVLERVRRAPLPEGCSKEIIVIDDGSTDGTTQMIARHAGAGDIIAGHHAERNFGKGTAIRTAIALASGDILLMQDGDLEYDPSDYARILEPIITGEADVVYGSRFLGKPVGMAARNRIANWILTTAVNLLYGDGLTDEATAYKAFRASVLRKFTSRAGVSNSARKLRRKCGVSNTTSTKCPSVTMRAASPRARRSAPAMASKPYGRW